MRGARGLALAILEAMQGEDWMMARDIADKLNKQGYQTSVKQVSWIIRERLTHLVPTLQTGKALVRVQASPGGSDMKIGIFCASSSLRVNKAMLEYLKDLDCEKVVGITSLTGPRDLPEGVIKVMAKASLGDAMKFISQGDEVEWVLSGPTLLNVLLAHQFHNMGRTIRVMVSWWTPQGYKRRFYPT